MQKYQNFNLKCVFARKKLSILLYYFTDHILNLIKTTWHLLYNASINTILVILAASLIKKFITAGNAKRV